MVLRLYVHIDETQSLFLAFDLYIISLILSEKQLEIQDSPACIAHCYLYAPPRRACICPNVTSRSPIRFDVFLSAGALKNRSLRAFGVFAKRNWNCRTQSCRHPLVRV